MRQTAKSSSGPHRSGHGARPAITWVGAHGGAGVTTLAAQFGGLDSGTNWPGSDAAPHGAVLLVARTHAAGLQSASRTLDALRQGRHPAADRLAALVLVADAPGRLPLKLARRVRVLRSAVRVVWVPWIAAWRVGDTLQGPTKEIGALAALTTQLSHTTEGRS
ncbi:DUF6668 family protein [Streptomyces sp. AK02-01A]|uniref:DUF6668 family protein n=1 Tax=Streptomyces sp. AK02-01A TaxID=3028648 RepID=UPI0029BF8F82|nr:DUF6668 family protein [Streptomyces sp. AK02-01A]MDX3850995.1 hypothetical protein [Streptomyces sp. AK02-01A]